MSHPAKHTNSLIHENSPYLLQHAHNPVHWYPWGEEAFAKAKAEGKLVLISIGYSSCHWCHVMEHESFEDEETAAVMNDFFVCIKVDREERPDVDQIYMLAVQLMTSQGGWPLNCFTLPDGRPIYGGTYFPNESWRGILIQLAELNKKDHGKLLEYAARLQEGISQAELVTLNTNGLSVTSAFMEEIVNNWKQQFDLTDGGPNRAPKFPLPNNYEFLLRYATLTKNESLLNYVNLTLTKIANGGIYDHIGGGFARYSTDTLWKVPHFEKMLYDNAQLVSLYSEAYTATKNPLYKKVVEETLAFISREMTAPEGSFYSALDADTDGEEGKFYLWQKEELQKLLGKNFDLYVDVYSVNEQGFWEGDHRVARKDAGGYIPLRHLPMTDICKKHNISEATAMERMEQCKQILLEARNKRTRPGLDDKQLTSWNALMLKGYADAYIALQNPEYLKAAETNADFILIKMKQHDDSLLHSYKNGKARFTGYLEDYCFTIEALLSLYTATFNEQYLQEAQALIEYTIQHFYDTENGMFFYTSHIHERLIARKTEINDNVIPASNSSMAKCLHALGIYMGNNNYIRMALQMLNNVRENMPRYGAGYSNWGQLALRVAFPQYEAVISGANAQTLRKEIQQHYLPNVLFAGTEKASSMGILKDRFKEGHTYIYVCKDRTCKLPVENVSDALKLAVD